MNEEIFFNNHFLIAMPSLLDPHFKQTVTYICEHNERGAIGININQPLTLSLADVFESIGVKATDEKNKKAPVLNGGPVQPERGFVIHPPCGEWRSSLILAHDIVVTTSRDILAALAKGEGPDEFVVALGYAGWGPNQLEEEVKQNAWLNCKATSDILFHTPFTKRWRSAAALLGVDITLLTNQAGHS